MSETLDLVVPAMTYASAQASTKVASAPLVAPQADQASSAVKEASEDGQEVDASIEKFPFKIVRVRNRDCFVAAYNPRPDSDIDPAYIAELAESIKAQGIHQAPNSRLVEVDGVMMDELVFGQCRWLANTLAFGEDGYITLVRREMTLAQAMAAAVTENEKRRDPGPLGDAEAGAKLLAELNGDRAECARVLGMTTQTLDKRLALMNCSEEVRKRLRAKAIQLGIAELLAGLPKKVQDRLLQKFDADGSVPTVAEFKKLIQPLAKTMASAIFDKSECGGCAHNSDRQAQMFTTNYDAGSCLNPKCYDAKTETALEASAERWRETYPTVQIIRVGEEGLVRPIVAEGERGVGPEQIEACRGCAKFGAAISGRPDNPGLVRKDVCFDAACNTEKVKAYQASIAPPEAETELSPEKEAGMTPAERAKRVIARSKKSGSATKGKAAPKATHVSGAVKDYRNMLYRTVIAKELAKAPERGHAMLLALAMNNRLSAVSCVPISQAVEAKTVGDKTKQTGLSADYARALKLEGPSMAAILSKMSIAAVASLSEGEIVEMVKVLEPSWDEHFTLGADFLTKLTKTEIQALCKENGLDKAYGNGFTTLFARKKDEIVKDLVEVQGFKYQGAMPKALLPKN